MGKGVPVMIEIRDLTDFDSPPSHGYWPDRFAVNRAWTDALDPVLWEVVPNSGGIQARKPHEFALALQLGADRHIYALTSAVYWGVDAYIAERTDQ